jgi:hypothetical protein
LTTRALFLMCCLNGNDQIAIRNAQIAGASKPQSHLLDRGGL